MSEEESVRLWVLQVQKWGDFSTWWKDKRTFTDQGVAQHILNRKRASRWNGSAWRVVERTQKEVEL